MKIIFTEEKRKNRETIECYISVAAMWLFPILMFLHWLVVGY